GPDRQITVERLVAAVDCGRVINPSLAEQQVESGLVWGLAQATIDAPEWIAGMPRARSFGGLGIPRISDIPQIMVKIIPSSADPGGLNGLSTTVVAPAVANAIYAGSGTRLRSLPFAVPE
ncbi:MAG: molybdopterin cofactor-binding domain-containing protein, partial [Sphingomicrobium sp.]